MGPGPTMTMDTPEGDPLTPMTGGQSKWKGEALSGLVADFQLCKGGHSESQRKIKSRKRYQKRDPFNL